MLLLRILRSNGVFRTIKINKILLLKSLRLKKKVVGQSCWQTIILTKTVLSHDHTVTQCYCLLLFKSIALPFCLSVHIIFLQIFRYFSRIYFNDIDPTYKPQIMWSQPKQTGDIVDDGGNEGTPKQEQFSLKGP